MSTPELITSKADGGTWSYIAKQGETNDTALRRIQRETVDRVNQGGEWVASDGTGAVEAPPPNIVCSRDPEALKAHGGTPLTGVSLGSLPVHKFPAPEVQFQVIRNLLFRRGDRHANELLKTAPDGVWALLSKRSYSEEITAPGAADRLQAARAKIKSETTAPAAVLGLLLDEEPTLDVAKGIEGAIASKELPVRDDHGRSTLDLAFERYPEPVAGGLLRRLEAGLELPYSAHDYLSNVTRDDGPIAALALDAKSPEAAGIAAARNCLRRVAAWFA